MPWGGVSASSTRPRAPCARPPCYLQAFGVCCELLRHNVQCRGGAVIGRVVLGQHDGPCLLIACTASRVRMITRARTHAIYMPTSHIAPACGVTTGLTCGLWAVVPYNVGWRALVVSHKEASLQRNTFQLHTRRHPSSATLSANFTSTGRLSTQNAVFVTLSIVVFYGINSENALNVLNGRL